MQEDVLNALWPKDRDDLVAVEESTPPQEEAATACPRCQKPMIDPQGLGWCRSCGFCKSLEDDRAQELLAKTAQRPSGPSFAAMAGNVPRWVWVALACVGVAATASFAVGRWLPTGNNLPRALWTSVQVAAGLALVLLGQVYAFITIAPEEEKLGLRDALAPMRLWPLVIKRMPRLSNCLWISTFGLAAALSGLLFIGGLQHWFSYLPNSKNKTQSTAGAYR